MSEYIKLDDVCRVVCSDESLNGYEKAYCVRLIRGVKSEEAAPVRYGRWGKANNRPKTYIRICSVCKQEAYFCGVGCSYKYCPNCGAKMRGESDERT